MSGLLRYLKTDGRTDRRTDRQGRLLWTPRGKPGVQNQLPNFSLQSYQLQLVTQKGIFSLNARNIRRCQKIKSWANSQFQYWSEYLNKYLSEYLNGITRLNRIIQMYFTQSKPYVKQNYMLTIILWFKHKKLKHLFFKSLYLYIEYVGKNSKLTIAKSLIIYR